MTKPDRVSRDDAAIASERFDDIDRRVFARLDSGALGPLKLTLRNGASLAGELKGVARRSLAIAGGAAQKGGTLLLVCDGAEIKIDYMEIADIN